LKSLLESSPVRNHRASAISQLAAVSSLDREPDVFQPRNRRRAA